MAELLFREVVHAHEVEAHLRLRRQVYAASPELAFIAARSDQRSSESSEAITINAAAVNATKYSKDLRRAASSRSWISRRLMITA